MKADEKQRLRGLKKNRLYIAILLILILLIAFAISYTGLMKEYIINFIIQLILDNKFNIIIISAVLIVLYNAEKQIYLKEQEKGDEYIE